MAVVTRTWLAGAAGVALGGLASVAHAQSASPPPAATIRLHVIDELGKSIDGVTISIITSDSTGVQSARYLVTNEDGRVSPRLDTSTIPYGYSTRRLGFAPTYGTIIVSTTDTVALDIRLARVSQALDTVRILANQRILMSNYALGASEIAASDKHIVNAADAIRYLRPTLLGLGPVWSGGCPWAENLWVNGQLQALAPLESFASAVPEDPPPAAVLILLQKVPVNVVKYNPKRIGVPSHIEPDVPLALIKSQYISEMHYVDCHHAEYGNHGENALYVSLKPGVAFDIKHGTYISDTTSARAAGVIP